MAKMESDKADMAQDKALIKKAFKQHDSQEHQGGVGTKLKLKKGGSIGAKMKSMGRNMARVANQRGSSRGK
jgi:hypothetical protein